MGHRPSIIHPLAAVSQKLLEIYFYNFAGMVYGPISPDCFVFFTFFIRRFLDFLQALIGVFAVFSPVELNISKTGPVFLSFWSK